MGDPAYEERRRLKAENDLLRERNENERLKRERAAEIFSTLAVESLTAFFRGEAALGIEQADGTTRFVRFCR